jgi:integrase
MAKTINRLSVKKVDNLKAHGWYPDGNGLYLQVSKSGSKSWVYRYQVDGKQKWHGLGSYTKENSLQVARSSALKCKQLRRDGIDPIDHKNQIKIDSRLATRSAITFKECAEQFIKSHREGWKNQKHASQWENTLDTYAYPLIGDLPVQAIDGDLVMRVLEPIWFTKTETASRVRQRIENILDWATVKEYRQGDNPALWRGRLDKLLPKRTKVQKPKHFPAMDYRDLPDYFATLRSKKTIASNALAFTILTATRNGEARSASYSEIDERSNIWIIPASRMKAEREHRIPLSDEAIAIITEMKDYKRPADDFVFTGLRPGRAISEAALLKLVKETHPNLTVHGFRSSFRDWCAEQTSFTREVAEAALAHSLKDKTEAAYQRGDLFEKRRSLMNDWTVYCLSGESE